MDSLLICCSSTVQIATVHDPIKYHIWLENLLRLLVLPQPKAATQPRVFANVAIPVRKPIFNTFTLPKKIQLYSSLDKTHQKKRTCVEKHWLGKRLGNKTNKTSSHSIMIPKTNQMKCGAQAQSVMASRPNKTGQITRRPSQGVGDSAARQNQNIQGLVLPKAGRVT